MKKPAAIVRGNVDYTAAYVACGLTPAEAADLHAYNRAQAKKFAETIRLAVAIQDRANKAAS